MMIQGNLKPFGSINKVTFHKVCGALIIAFLISLAAFKYLVVFKDESERIQAYATTTEQHSRRRRDCFDRFLDEGRRHMRIDKQCMDRDLFVVGDVHGCFIAFKQLLKKANVSCTTHLVILSGDFSNKGPKSKGMIDYVRSSTSCVLSVMGNHEYKVLEYRKWGKQNTTSADFSEPWEQQQISWADELDEQELQFMQKLPYTISIPSLNVIVVHARLDPSLPLTEQSKELMMSVKHRSHIRHNNQSVFNNTNDRTINSNVTNPPHNISEGWAASWNRSELVIFGHDSSRGLQIYDNALGLDTGCVYGKQLTGVMITKRHNGSALEELLSIKSPPTCTPNHIK